MIPHKSKASNIPIDNDIKIDGELILKYIIQNTHKYNIHNYEV